MKLSSFRTVIKIDDPTTGAPRDVHLKVKRFTVEEGTQFARDYQRSANPPSNVMLARKGDGDEQEKKTIIVKPATDTAPAVTEEAFVISDAVVQARRLNEMTEEQRALYDRLDAAEEEFSRAFLVNTLTRYVRVVPGQDLTTVDDFENDDAEPAPIITGADLAKAFGGREKITMDLLRVVHMENTYGEAAKKVLRSAFGFVPSSVAHEPAADGQKPDQTAEAAAPPVSVGTEDADRNMMAPSSGSPATE